MCMPRDLKKHLQIGILLPVTRGSFQFYTYTNEKSLFRQYRKSISFTVVFII